MAAIKHWNIICIEDEAKAPRHTDKICSEGGWRDTDKETTSKMLMWPGWLVGWVDGHTNIEY